MKLIEDLKDIFCQGDPDNHQLIVQGSAVVNKLDPFGNISESIDGLLAVIQNQDEDDDFIRFLSNCLGCAQNFPRLVNFLRDPELANRICMLLSYIVNCRRMVSHTVLDHNERLIIKLLSEVDNAVLLVMALCTTSYNINSLIDNGILTALVSMKNVTGAITILSTMITNKRIIVPEVIQLLESNIHLHVAMVTLCKLSANSLKLPEFPSLVDAIKRSEDTFLSECTLLNLFVISVLQEKHTTNLIKAIIEKEKEEKSVHAFCKVDISLDVLLITAMRCSIYDPGLIDFLERTISKQRVTILRRYFTLSIMLGLVNNTDYKNALRDKPEVIKTLQSLASNNFLKVFNFTDDMSEVYNIYKLIPLVANSILTVLS